MCLSLCWCGAAPAPLHPVPPGALLSPLVPSGHWGPKSLSGGDPGWFSRPCSPLQPHFWGSVGILTLQPRLSLLLGLILMLPPASQELTGELLGLIAVAMLCLPLGCWSFFSCLGPAVLPGCGGAEAGTGQGGTAVPVSGVQPPLRWRGCAHDMERSHLQGGIVRCADTLVGSLSFLKILFKIVLEVNPGSRSAAQESQDAVTLQQLKVGVAGL